MRLPLPLRLTSFYELYKRFLKDNGCKWHDIVKVLSAVAEILFDVDGACSGLGGKVSFTWVVFEHIKYSYDILLHFRVNNRSTNDASLFPSLKS